MAENILHDRQGTNSEVSEAEDLYETCSEYSEDEDLLDQQGTSSENSGARQRNEQVMIMEEEIIDERKIRLLCEVCVGECPSVSVRLFEQEFRSEVERWFEERVAVYLCFDCEMYVCRNCLFEHRSHRGMKVGRKESEREMEGEASGNEGKLRLLLDDLMKESKTERMEKFENSRVRIYDRVNVKHELDRDEKYWISGLCVLENTRWVACDRYNHCIKIFSLGSNLLQRYVRVGSEPWDVTEIFVNQNSTEPNLESGSRSEVSVTARAEQNKHCLVAVTLPGKRKIVFIDLSKKPALLHKVIHTEKECHCIKFYDGKIFTVCGDLGWRWSVYKQSTDGVTINKFDTGSYGYFPGPDLAVVSGQVYLTYWHSNKVQCRNVEGQLINEITFEGSELRGTSVDQDKNVYVCAGGHNKVYKLNADLTQYKLVLDRTAGYINQLRALCHYRDNLFMSHHWPPSLYNYVSVVGLL